jgi:hypothetical protein
MGNIWYPPVPRNRNFTQLRPTGCAAGNVHRGINDKRRLPPGWAGAVLDGDLVTGIAQRRAENSDSRISNRRPLWYDEVPTRVLDKALVAG